MFFTRRLASQASSSQKSEAFLFLDSVFPIRLGRWDLRHYIGLLREEHLLNTISSHLESVNTHGFRILSLEPYHKDGGVFVRFQYLKDESNGELDNILAKAKYALAEHGGSPSWMGYRHGGTVWLVKGIPWREDMDRFASSILKVTFEGPDVHEQSLFEALRPFGRIHDVTSPTSVPAGTPRTSVVIYERVKSAVIARNVVHGMVVDNQNTSKTRFRAEYQKPMQAHTIRNWISSHPKIVVPLIVFLLGTLTYAVFDPIRSLMIQSKLTHWFDYREYGVFKWFQKHTIHRFPSLPAGEDIVSSSDVWKERKDAEASLKMYLSDIPSTIAFLYGPQGSGKNRMMETLLHDIERNVLVIDCGQLNQATSDAQLIGALATQTGYRPVFTFLNSITALIDLASVGLIGQKTGLSTSLPDQLRQMLQTTTEALEKVVTRYRTAQEKLNQVYTAKVEPTEKGINDNGIPRQAQVVGVEALPVVVISHFSSRVGPHRQEVPDILMQWAANLVERQVAHVVVISDNRENAKQAAKALPTKPLYVIPLSDADAASSLAFMKQKLQDFGMNIDFTREQTAYIERIGGRASDLESLIYKVRTGQRVEDAVEEIIERGVNELRKKAFGDDEEDCKRLPWTREQAWKIVKSLSEQSEISYYDVLLDLPFSGEGSPLREMEHAEIISITTREGRPSTIKPGRPILKWVFTRLTSDSIFVATEEISYNSRLISGCEKTIKSCEDELVSIKQVMETQSSSGWFSSRDKGLRMRAQYVTSKLYSAQKKVEALENVNRGLRKTLVEGDKNLQQQRMSEAQRKEFEAFTRFFASFTLSRSVSSVADLSDGSILFEILSTVDTEYFRHSSRTPSQPTDNWVLRFNALKRLYRLMTQYFTDVLQKPTSSLDVPDLQALAKDHSITPALSMCRLTIVIGVQCEKNKEFIEKIQGLGETDQHHLMKAIEQVMAPLTTVHDTGETMTEDDHYYMVQSQRSQIILEKMSLEKAYQALLEEHRTLQTNYDDVLSDREEMLAQLREMKREVEIRRNEKSDVILRPEIERLRTDLQKSEDNLALAESELDRQTSLVTDLTRKIDELQVVADEASRLRDQVDEYRHAADKLQKTENVMEKYKKKLQESADLRQRLKALEKQNADLVDKNASMEEEFRKVTAFKPLMESYKSRIADLESKNVTRTQANENLKFELEQARTKLRITTEERTKDSETLELYQERVRELELLSHIRPTATKIARAEGSIQLKSGIDVEGDDSKNQLADTEDDDHAEQGLGGELDDAITGTTMTDLKIQVKKLERELEAVRNNEVEASRVLVLENLLEDANRMKARYENNYLAAHREKLILQRDLEEIRNGKSFDGTETAIALRQQLNETVEQFEALRKDHAELEIKFEAQQNERDQLDILATLRQFIKQQDELSKDQHAASLSLGSEESEGGHRTQVKTLENDVARYKMALAEKDRRYRREQELILSAIHVSGMKVMRQHVGMNSQYQRPDSSSWLNIQRRMMGHVLRR